MQVNYELLTKHIDPQGVLGSMFARELISFEDKMRIKSTQEQRGKRSACEEMLDILFNKWKKGTCERFIQVLESCDYKECAAQIQSKVISNTYNAPCTHCRYSVHNKETS